MKFCICSVSVLVTGIKRNPKKKVSHVSVVSLYLTQEIEHSVKQDIVISCNKIVVMFTFFTFLFIM